MIEDVFLAAAKREAGLRDWLEQNASHVFAEQKHLDAGTEARAYWHHGYMMALRDIIALQQPQPVSETMQ